MSVCNCNGNWNLCIQQGATFEETFTWTEQTCNAIGSQPEPVNLTGYTAQMQIRPFPGSTTLLYDASANITLGGAAGTVELEIPASTTAGFTWWAGYYDLLLTDPTGFVTRLLSGQVEICPAVTGTQGAPQFFDTPSGQSFNVPSGQGILTP